MPTPSAPSVTCSTALKSALSATTDTQFGHRLATEALVLRQPFKAAGRPTVQQRVSSAMPAIISIQTTLVQRIRLWLTKMVLCNRQVQRYLKALLLCS